MGRRLKGGNHGNGSDGGPLRKVIGVCFVGGVRMECYECGHIAMPKSDIIGETNAARRRCYRCKGNKPIHFTGKPPERMTNDEYDERNKTGQYKPLTEEDWQKVFELRCKSRRGVPLSKDEAELCERCRYADRERYSQQAITVFDATQSSGA